MSAPNAVNILRSNAVVWYAPEGETEPDETSVAAEAAWGGNWARIGYTAAPLTWTLNEERGLIAVEEELMPIDQFGMNLIPTFTTELAEVTADYLALLFGGTVSTTAAGASQKGYEELDIDPTGLVVKYALGFEAVRLVSGVAQPTRVFFRRATFKINGDLVYSKKTDTYVRVPIMVQALGGVAGGAAPIRFQRVTAAATS